MIDNKARSLVELENWFARLNMKVPNHFVLCAQFEGMADLQMWDVAINAVIARHPMLRVRIEDDGDVLVLRDEPSSAVEFTDESTTDQFRWKQCIQELMVARLGIDGGPLVLIHLIQGNGWSDLVVAAHHSIADGLGIAYLIRDVLLALDGERLLSYPMPANVSLARERTLGALPQPEEVVSRNWRTPFRTTGRSVPEIFVNAFSREETRLLTERCKEQGTTISGALAAALFLSARRLREVWRSRPIRMLTAVDLRRRFGLKDELMLATTAVPVILPAAIEENFWEMARWARSQVIERTSKESILQSAARSNANWSKYKTSDELMSFYEEFLGFDILFTNLGIWPAPHEATALRLKAAWGPSVLVGLEGEQGISAITVEGELRILHISFAPERDLLSQMMHLLRGAI